MQLQQFPCYNVNLMWQKRLARNWNKTKAFLGDKYQTMGKWAGQLDQAAGIGRRIFAAAAPLLDDLGQGAAVRQGMDVVRNYDRLRGAAMEIDSNVRGHASRIGSADIF